MKITTRQWRFFTVEGHTFFHPFGKKRNHRFLAVFALSENSNLWCFKQIFECLFLPGSFCCYSVLFSFLFWCVMSNKCYQSNLLFQYTTQSHLFILPWNIWINKSCLRSQFLSAISNQYEISPSLGSIIFLDFSLIQQFFLLL